MRYDIVIIAWVAVPHHIFCDEGFMSRLTASQTPGHANQIAARQGHR
jgi:hypothetical protein